MFDSGIMVVQNKAQSDKQAMDRRIISRKRKMNIIMMVELRMEEWRCMILFVTFFVILFYEYFVHRRRQRLRLLREPGEDTFYLRNIRRTDHLNSTIFCDDGACVAHLRMDLHTFAIFCTLLREFGRLEDTRHTTVEEMAAAFLYIIGHHQKISTIKRMFIRSSETISRQFHMILNGVIQLQDQLLKAHLAVSNETTDFRWKYFKGCLGALDGTFIKLHVPAEDRPRYRNRKGDISTNVLAACSQDMQFTFILAGWEGSAADSRILRDAIARPYGLRVPHGHYYLVDAGYPNAEGFLAPFRGQRYHLSEWTPGHQPTSPEEFFNMVHSRARNCIERCFGAIKNKFSILRSPAFYPVKTQIWIIMACCLLHNLIKREMLYMFVEDDPPEDEGFSHPHGDPIEYLDSSNPWGTWRYEMAVSMYNEWMES